MQINRLLVSLQQLMERSMDWQSMSNPAIIAEIGNRLKSYRLRKNYTQEEVAIKSGISTLSVHKIERGQTVSFSILISVLRTLRLLEHLDSLIPEIPVSPIELMKLRGKQKQRASGNKNRSINKNSQ